MPHGKRKRVALFGAQNSQMASPLRLLLLLSANFTGNTNYQRSLEIYNVVVLVSCNDLVATLFLLLYQLTITFLVVLSGALLVIAIRLQCLDIVEVVLYLPATSPYLEEDVGKTAAILPVRHCTQVTERPVNDCHVDSWADVAGRYSA